MSLPRTLQALVAALFLAAALAPCPLVAGMAADPPTPSAGGSDPSPSSLRVYCPCGCGPAPPALRIAGATLAMPPSAPIVSLPALCHDAPEPLARLPERPRLPIDHVPLPV